MFLSLEQLAITIWLQGENPDRVLLILFIVGAVLCILVLGLPMFRNLYYILITPTYSIKSAAQEDNFFSSLLLTFLGGLFLGLYGLILRNYLSDSYHTFAQNLITNALAGYPNPVYKQIVLEDGIGRMEGPFELYFLGNIVWFSLAWVIFWFLVGILAWIGARVFGNQGSIKLMLSALAYPLMLAGAVGGYFFLRASGSILANYHTGISLGVIEIIAGVILLLVLVFVVLAISQGGDLTVGQAIAVTLVWMIIIGGGLFAVYYYQVQPNFTLFLQELQSKNPGL